MLYKNLDTVLKKKLSGSMNFHLRDCNLDDSDKKIIKEFLIYSLFEDPPVLG